MTVTPLSIDHVDQIVELQTQGFSDGWSKQSLISGIEKGGLKGSLVFQDDKLIGFVTYACNPDFCELMDILTHQDFRNQGVATLLLGDLFEKAKATSPKIFLEVRESNIPAISLYLKHGFIKTSTRKKYYSDGENAIVMEKELL